MLTVITIQKGARYDVWFFEKGKPDRKYKGVSAYSLHRIDTFCERVGEVKARLKMIVEDE